MSNVIEIDFDKKCAECGKGGSTQSGICLECTAKAIRGLPMKSEIGDAVQKRFQKTLPKK